MFLIDANILLEVLLDQENAGQVKQFLKKVPLSSLYLSRFALDAIGVVLFHRQQQGLFTQMITDLVVRGGINVIHLEAKDMADVGRASRQFELDFDDAYQYVVAEKHNLTLVSFDADFDRTDRGRKTPSQIMQQP